MRKRDKILVMEEANKRLESSWLQNKILVKEETNIDSLLQNQKIKSTVDKLTNNPEELKKAINGLLSLGISKEDLSKTIKAMKGGQPIDNLTKDIVQDINGLTEGDDSFIDKTIDKWSKETVDQNKLTRMLAGAKFGSILGALGGSLMSSTLFIGGVAKDPTELLLATLLGVVSSAIVGSQTTK